MLRLVTTQDLVEAEIAKQQPVRPEKEEEETQARRALLGFRERSKKNATTH